MNISLEALGAFLAGAASIISARWAMKRAHQQDEEECEKRIAALKEGIEIGEHHEKAE